MAVRGQVIKIASFAVFLALSASHAHAWVDHFRVTGAALAPLRELDGVEVRYSTFAELARSLGERSALALKTAAGIKKTYVFEEHLQLGEAPGERLPLRDVLARYSDEPDWGMDTELFGPDEYPEAWKAEYRMMGGKKGLSSQSFRHMYWPAAGLGTLIGALKIPPTQMFHPWGEAPARARVYAELSRRAARAGQSYWWARFLALSIHYLEDVSQPWHTSQLPTKRIAFMPFLDASGAGTKDYARQLQTLVSYYHLGFEDVVAVAMREGTEGLTAALGADTVAEAGPAPEERVRRMAARGLEHSADAGTTALDFLPPLPGNFATIDMFGYLNGQFITDTAKRVQEQSGEKARFFDVARTMFRELGPELRAFVKGELTPPR